MYNAEYHGNNFNGVNQLNRNIKSIRGMNGDSQQETADKMNMNQNTYASIENGNARVGVEFLEKFAVIYQLSVQEIIDWHKIKALHDSKEFKPKPDFDEMLNLCIQEKGKLQVAYDLLTTNYNSLSKQHNDLLKEHQALLKRRRLK